MYAFGGVTNWDYETTDEVEIYEIEKDVWKKGPSLSLVLNSFGCLLINLRL